MSTIIKWIGGLKRAFSSLASGICGRKMIVKETTEGLGYTMSGKEIFIGFNHPILGKLKEDEKAPFLEGVLVHEVLHQIFTDFKHFELRVKEMQLEFAKTGKYDKLDVSYFQSIFNLVEDAAIETFAPTVIGGTPLRCLYFTIDTLYKLEGELGNSAYPSQELMNALCLFGDGGIVKGNFQFKEAKEAFDNIIEDFYDALNDPIAQNRVDKSYAIYEKVKYLWSGTDEEEKAKQADAIRKAFKDACKEISDGLSSGRSSGKDASPSGGSKKDSKRKAFIKKEKIEAKKGSSESEISKISSSKEVSSGKNPSKSSSKESDNENAEEFTDLSEISTDSKDSSDDNSENEGFSDLDDAAKDFDKEDSSDTTKDAEHDDSEENSEEDSDSEGFCKSLDDIEELTEEEEELLSEDTTPAITSKDIEAIKKASEEIPKEDRNEALDKYGEINNFPDNSKISKDIGIKEIGVKNILIDNSADKDSEYAEIVESISDGITSAIYRLKNIFKNDKEERVHKRSGKLDLKRYSSGKMTVNMFTRKRRPAQKENAAIMIVTDQSGSMRGNKMYNAALANIGICEIMAHFNIPTYCMGFTTDLSSPEKVEHRHFVRWNNSLFERTNLCYMKASYDNFDAFAIRSALSILKKRKEKHKIMIIISDGIPESDYSRGSNGIMQNKEAIDEAKRSCKVLGIGVKCREKDFAKMYGPDNFIIMNDPNELFNILSDKIIMMIDGKI